MNKGSFVFSGVFIALLSACSFQAAAEDYSRVDCNQVEVRKALIEAYNDVLDSNNAGVKVIDAYDQVTVKAGKDKLECTGTYDFSDGDSAKVKYRTYLNSMGEPIDEFVPVE
ncbi:hypothetical protein F3J29_16675 [Enterobacter sp. Cy-643]|uniref:hypothetical protein n=1 Tax=Enterobacter sp. Cy-643 TaxID=2608346 RepID=UPI0014200969|nr:hypothetical protein [Enterobacter sp. Cy-643]NIF33764.1 hypothetical protein [Enterobacter sp. Cy-643]